MLNDVKKGAVLSSIYIDGLLVRLKLSGIGFHAGRTQARVHLTMRKTRF